ncbi:MAG: hypothetical protein ABGX23_00270 [Nautiliaceae bacterium]
MKEVFKYTFLSVAEIKKFFILVAVISILTFFERLPFIGITIYFLDKIIYLSVGVFLVHLAMKSKNDEDFYKNLKSNEISNFFLYGIPQAIGIILATTLIMAFWFIFLALIFKFTSQYDFFSTQTILFFQIAIINSPITTKILIGIYSIYFMLYSYIFLGKFGEALSKETFKDAFISLLSSLIDFKFWVKTFNLKYMLIYLIWSLIVGSLYFFALFFYVFILSPTLYPSLTISNIIILPLFIAFLTILYYLTFFSAYFSYKSTL